MKTATESVARKSRLQRGPLFLAFGWNLARSASTLPARLLVRSKLPRIIRGGEWGPVTFPAFKAGDSSLRGWNGGFDFHTPPPYFSNVYAGVCDVLSVVQRRFSGLLA